MLSIAKKGFTVVELAVVIAVVAILSSVVVVGYQRIASDGDNAKSLAEYNDIRNAVELYAARHGTYPECPGGANDCSLSAMVAQLGVEGIRTNYSAMGAYQYYWQNQTSSKGWSVRMYDKSNNRTCTMNHGKTNPWPSSPACWASQ